MITKELQETLNFAAMEAIKRRHEYVTLEHLLYALLHERTAARVVHQCGGDANALTKELEQFFEEKIESVPASSDALPEYTAAFQRVVEYALLQAEGSGQKEVDGGNVLAALFQSPNSHAVYLLKKQGITRLEGEDRPAHRARTGSRAHDSGAVPPPQEQPGLRRRPRRRQDRDCRRAGAQDSEGRGARRPEGRR